VGSVQDIRLQSPLRVLIGKRMSGRVNTHITEVRTNSYSTSTNKKDILCRLDRGPIGAEEFAQIRLAIWEGKRTAPFGAWGKNKNMETDTLPVRKDNVSSSAILCLLNICDLLLDEGAVLGGENLLQVHKDFVFETVRIADVDSGGSRKKDEVGARVNEDEVVIGRVEL